MIDKLLRFGSRGDDNANNDKGSLLRPSKSNNNQELETTPGGSDILRALDIDPDFSMPKDIIPTAAVKKVQFNSSKPIGYYSKEVDEFVRDMIHTMEYLYTTIHQRNQDVVTLGNEYNKLQEARSNERYETEFAQIKNSVISESQTSESLVALQEDNSQLRREKEALEQEVLALSQSLGAQGTHMVEPTPETGALTDTERAEFEEWANSVTTAYNTLELTSQQQGETINALTEQNATLTEQLSQWEEYANSLQAALEEAPAQESTIDHAAPAQEEYYQPAVEEQVDQQVAQPAFQEEQYVAQPVFQEEQYTTTPVTPVTDMVWEDDVQVSTPGTEGYYAQENQESYNSVPLASPTDTYGDYYAEPAQPALTPVTSLDNLDNSFAEPFQNVETESDENDFYDENILASSGAYDDIISDSPVAPVSTETYGQAIDYPLTPEVSVDDYYAEGYDHEGASENLLNEFNESVAFVQHDDTSEQYDDSYVDNSNNTVLHHDDFAVQDSVPLTHEEFEEAEEHNDSLEEDQEEDNDDGMSNFDRMFAEMNRDRNSDAPELGENLVRARGAKKERAPITAGSPLTSIPEGADLRDYL